MSAQTPAPEFAHSFKRAVVPYATGNVIEYRCDCGDGVSAPEGGAGELMLPALMVAHVMNRLSAWLTT